MKIIKLLSILILSFIATHLMAQQKDIILKRDKGSITFTVDENLSVINSYPKYLGDGKWLARALANDKNLTNPEEGLVASSFQNDRMAYGGQDLLFSTIVRSFAEHRPLVLSPDMVWLVIAQGFSHYVNQHAEELRDKLVSHQGKQSLVVETSEDLLSGDPNWEGIFAGFETQIAESSKGGIAQTITADFTTSGPTERIASQITLMDVMKEYFEYIVIGVSCGIPSITLQGTPEDWQKVHDKAMALEAYDMRWWTRDLDPILTEFVRAAEGHPNQSYWQDMVMKMTPERLRGGGCSLDKPTMLDGWFLHLFPFDKEGKRISLTIPHNKQMLSEIVDVPFRYIFIHEDGRTTETPMRLYAGFVGMKEDLMTRALVPQIGWMVRISEGQDLRAQEMEMKANKDGGQGLDLRISRVPEALRSIKSLNRLSLTFIGHIELPEWMDDIRINQFQIEGGELTAQEKEALQKRFPQLRFGFVKVVDEVEVITMTDEVMLDSKLLAADAAATDDNHIYNYPDQMPSFPGGEEALYQWIYDHTQYPAECKEQGIQGRAMAKFVVEKDGSIGQISITRSPHNALSDEAIRLLKSMPKWKPAQHNGKTVRSYYHLPVMFSIAK